MGRRTLLLVAALLLAAIGTGVLFVFLQATAKTLTPAATGRTVPVLVPRQEVQEGTPIEDVGLDTVNVDEALAQRGGFVLATQVKSLAKKVATRRLPANTPINDTAFGDSVTGSSKIKLAPDTMSIAVEVDDPARVGTFLYPGAKVTLWLTRTVGEQHQAQVVLPVTTIATIGAESTIVTPAATPEGNGAAARGTSSIVVLQVSQEDAAKVLLAQQSGDLYFTLLGPGTTPTQGTYDDSDLTKS